MAHTPKQSREMLRIYDEFVTDMGEYVFSLLSLHYQAIQGIKQNWASIVPYMPTMEQNIIRHARLFLRLNVTPNTTFLRELTYLMSKHIAKYVAPANKTLTFNQTVKTIQKNLEIYNIHRPTADEAHNIKMAKAKSRLERKECNRENSKEIKRMFAGCYYGYNGRGGY